MAERNVSSVVTAHRQLEGGGFPVRRPFPTHGTSHVDPFLLLDEMGPVDWGPGEAIGAPDHPHRGFETVTYLLKGRMEHRDSGGHVGRLGPGDVQWMTAGGGVVHSEMPEPEFKRRGGVMHGFQLWVNLPRRDKMMPLRYQEIPRAEIPTATSDDKKVVVRVIAGESMGLAAAIETRTPIMYLHFTVQPGGRITQAIPQDYNGFAWVFAGAGRFGPDGHEARSGQMVTFEPGGDQITAGVPVDAGEAMEILVLGGVPLGEPIARYGPFVMNTPGEIQQAFLDYQSGRLGRIQ